MKRPDATSRVELPPELSAALRKILEKLQQLLPELPQLSKTIGLLPFSAEALAKIAKPKVEPDMLDSRLHHLGGDGNAAHWEWLVYKKGGSRVIASGLVQGQRQQAALAARRASIEYCEKLKKFRSYYYVASQSVKSSRYKVGREL